MDSRKRILAKNVFKILQLLREDIELTQNKNLPISSNVINIYNELLDYLNSLNTEDLATEAEGQISLPPEWKRIDP